MILTRQRYKPFKRTFHSNRFFSQQYPNFTTKMAEEKGNTWDIEVNKDGAFKRQRMVCDWVNVSY